MPAHHTLETYLDEYIEATGLRGQSKTHLFRSAVWYSGELTGEPMHQVDAYRTVRRRTAAAGFTQRLRCPPFRASGITTHLHGRGAPENAPAMRAHESRRT